MKLYTGTDCPTCENAKAIIKTKGIELEIIHIDMKQRAGRDIAMHQRIMGVPVLDADKRYVWADVITYLNNL